MTGGIPKACLVDLGGMFRFCNYHRNSEEHVANRQGKWMNGVSEESGLGLCTDDMVFRKNN